MTVRALGPFLALTFGLTWGLAAALVLFPGPIEAAFGEIGYTHPLFILAVWSPGIAGMVLVWRHHGARGLAGFLRRLTLWRMPWGWWAFLAVGIPAAFYAGAALAGTLSDPFPFSPWHRVLPALVPALLIGPVEELGWRGVALPLLQRRMAPFPAGLLLGVVWAAWHIPAFFVGGAPQSSWSFPAFFLGVVALSVIMTPMFNASRGSLLIAALFHFQTNVPAWPDARPWDSALFVLVGAVVAWLHRRAMFTRDGGVTRLVAPGHPGGPVFAEPGEGETRDPP